MVGSLYIIDNCFEISGFNYFEVKDGENINIVTIHKSVDYY